MFQIRTRPEFRFRWNLSWYRFRSGRFDRNQTVGGTAIFFHAGIWIIGFLCFLLMSYLHHVLPSSSLADSRTPFHFYPPVPRLYHVLPSSSRLHPEVPETGEVDDYRTSLKGSASSSTGQPTGTGTQRCTSWPDVQENCRK